MGIDPSKASEALFLIVTNGMFASFGAIANYLYSITEKSKPASWGAFLINIVLGFFTGNLIGSFLPTDFTYRDGTLLIAGFVCYRLLAIIERAGPAFLAKKFLGIVEEATRDSPPANPPAVIPLPPPAPPPTERDPDKDLPNG